MMRCIAVVAAVLVLLPATCMADLLQFGGPHPLLDEVAILPDVRKLVHLDTPSILERGHLAAIADVRVFGSEEDAVYTTLALHYGLGNNWEAIARGAFAPKRRLTLPGGATIRHGGNDVEVAFRYQPAGQEDAAIMMGLAFPGTAAQRDAVLTLGGMAAFHGIDRLILYLNPRALFLETNTLAGIGVGARVRITDALSFVGDWTFILSGENTRDTRTGARLRRDVYGVAVRYALSGGEYTIDVGYANGTGSTTGFGLTPALGGDGTVYASITVRR